MNMMEPFPILTKVTGHRLEVQQMMNMIGGTKENETLWHHVCNLEFVQRILMTNFTLNKKNSFGDDGDTSFLYRILTFCVFLI